MSVRPSERQAANAFSKSTVPVAGPTNRSASAPKRQAPLALIADPEASAAFSWTELWTPTNLRSWAWSMTLHGLLLRRQLSGMSRPRCGGQSISTADLQDLRMASRKA